MGVVRTQNRLGQEFAMKSGEIVKIIAYRNSTDCDVQFADGAIRTSVRFSNVQNGKLVHPSKLGCNMVGNTYTNKQGLKATVITYHNSENIDIQFEDGAIRYGARKSALEEGSFLHPSVMRAIGENAVEQRVGQANTMRCGEQATIVAYRKAMDIDVKFADGTIRTGVTYDAFCRGNVTKFYTPKVTPEQREGLIAYNKNGMYMTIIKYETESRVTIRFEDGHETISRYSKFKAGAVPHPSGLKAQVSFQEAILLYYLKPLGFQKYAKGYWKKFDKRFGKMELDLFNEQYMYAVEYDGVRFHSTPTKIAIDELKEVLCKAHNIRLIPIREVGLPMEKHPNAIVRYKPMNRGELEQIITIIVDDFNKYAHTEYVVDVNIARDLHGIIDIYNTFEAKKIERVGEQRRAKDGRMMTIIAYANYNNLTVEYDDGMVVSGISYYQFQRGEVPRVAKRLGHAGEERVTRHGEHVKLLVYRGKNDVDVQFESGEIRTTTYPAFVSDKLTSMQYQTQKYADRIGQTNINQQGRGMTIVGWNDSQHITVQFDNGVKKENVTYQSFQRGRVLCPGDKIVRKRSEDKVEQMANSRIGQVFYNKQHERLTIVEYHGSNDVTVVFDDGTILEHVAYAQVKRGYVAKVNQAKQTVQRNQKEKVGEVRTAKNGFQMTIVEYNNTNNIIVEFEDGVRTQTRYCCFKNGQVPHPAYRWKRAALKVS